MNIRSTAHFRPGNIAAVLEQVTTRNIAATTKATEVVMDQAKENCPVRTGRMQGEIYMQVTVEGLVVTGSVIAPTEYAGYVEFGTGIRGAASEWSGPYGYSESWPGMPAQAPLRRAIDETNGQVIDAYRQEGFNV